MTGKRLTEKVHKNKIPGLADSIEQNSQYKAIANHDANKTKLITKINIKYISLRFTGIRRQKFWLTK